MRLEDFFLICFGVGASLTVISFMAGRLHFATKFHLPKFTQSGHHGGVAKGPMKGTSSGGSDSGASVDFSYVSPYNFPSMTMFLAWFGGIGFLVTHKYGMEAFFAVPLAIIGGIAGGWIIYRFLKLVLSYESPLDDADFEMVGMVGKLGVSIRAGEDGHGELIFEQKGHIRCCGARAENGEAIAKDTEVVVTGFDAGIATVKPWTEFSEM